MLSAPHSGRQQWAPPAAVCCRLLQRNKDKAASMGGFVSSQPGTAGRCLLGDRQQQVQKSHRIMQRDVVVAVVLRPFAFESAVLQGEADVGRDRDVLRFGKFELSNAKLRMGRSPGCRYIQNSERSSSSVPS